MLHLSAALNVNSLIWISSLEPNEQGTTHRVHDDLQPYFLSIGLPFKSVEPKTANQLLTCLEAIERRAKAGLRPIIHFDTHGSAEQGLYIAGSGEFVPWTRLVDKLRKINIATKNNLCVVSAACCSMHAIKPITIGEPTPFFALIAPEQTVSFWFIEQNTVKFYEEVFGGLDVVAAYEKYFAPKLALFHCERLLGIALTKYICDSCMGKGLKTRREDLMTRVFSSGGLSNSRQNRRMVRKKVKELIRPNQALIDRYIQSFLIGKKVPFSIQQIVNLAKAERARPP
jgi:hypothetical protein